MIDIVEEIRQLTSSILCDIVHIKMKKETSMRFIGDVHGKWKKYKRIIKDCDASIQVGDLGLGFVRKHGWSAGQIYSNPPHYAMVKGDHKFIRGNHDNPG